MKQSDFLSAFIGNGARARLLRVFLFNPNEVLTTAFAAKRAGVSAAAVTQEAKALEVLGIVKRGKVAKAPVKVAVKKVATKKKGKKVVKKVATPNFEVTYTLNPEFVHMRALSSFVHEVSPAQYDTIVDALKRSGKLGLVILSGSFMGDSSRPADILVAVDSLNEGRLEQAIKKLEPIFGREIRYAAFSTPEFRYRLTVQDRLIRDTLDFPHSVLLDRARLL